MIIRMIDTGGKKKPSTMTRSTIAGSSDVLLRRTAEGSPEPQRADPRKRDSPPDGFRVAWE